jgi:hypothetical protein
MGPWRHGLGLQSDLASFALSPTGLVKAEMTVPTTNHVGRVAHGMEMPEMATVEQPLAKFFCGTPATQAYRRRGRGRKWRCPSHSCNTTAAQAGKMARAAWGLGPWEIPLVLWRVREGLLNG